MDYTQIWALFTAHNYLAVAVLVIGWLTTMLGPDSKFPLTLPKLWGRDARPLVVALLGMTYGMLVARQDGDAWLAAAQHGLVTGLLTMGLFDLVVKFAFNGKPPAWLQALALIFPPPKLPAPGQLPKLYSDEPTPVTPRDPSVRRAEESKVQSKPPFGSSGS